MKLFNDFDRRLEASLRGLKLDAPIIRVLPADSAKYKCFADIISETFEGMDEAERQAIAWGRILETLDDEDQRRIEFMYTDAPSERGVLSETESSL